MAVEGARVRHERTVIGFDGHDGNTTGVGHHEWYIIGQTVLSGMSFIPQTTEQERTTHCCSTPSMWTIKFAVVIEQ